MKTRFSRFLALAIVTVCLGQSVLTNDAVIKMVKAGLGDDIVVSTVKAQPGNYTTGPDDLIALKKAGVSDKVIAAMVEKNAAAGAAPAAAPAPAGAVAQPGVAVDGDVPQGADVGVFYKKSGKWEEMLPEVVNWKTGGVVKHVASVGVVKGDVNGHVQFPHSRNTGSFPLEVLIYTPEGTSFTEYQLVRLHENNDNREFRTVTGGVFHKSGGAGRDMIPYEGKKVAPRMYKVILPPTIGTGEYGFLPPGITGSSAGGSNGKIYTIRIIE